MKISVCIPTYGMKGKGAFYLHKNLSSIFMQTEVPYEVVISDHSIDDEVEKAALSWKDLLNIKYFRNSNKIGCISANLNNCMEKCSGDVLDFMLQDDYYFCPWSLKKRIEMLSSSQWAVTSTLHYSVERDQFYWHLIPEYRSDIYLGFNSIGSPSLLTMKKNSLTFDENLLMLTDCDYYKQLHDSFGKPNTTSEITVISCIWEGQSQNSISSENKEKEIQIVKDKYEKM